MGGRDGTAELRQRLAEMMGMERCPHLRVPCEHCSEGRGGPSFETGAQGVQAGEDADVQAPATIYEPVPDAAPLAATTETDSL